MTGDNCSVKYHALCRNKHDVYSPIEHLRLRQEDLEIKACLKTRKKEGKPLNTLTETLKSTHYLKKLNQLRRQGLYLQHLGD